MKNAVGEYSIAESDHTYHQNNWWQYIATAANLPLPLTIIPGWGY